MKKVAMGHVCVLITWMVMVMMATMVNGDNVARITKSILLQENNQWVAFYNAPSLTKTPASSSSGITTVFLSEGVQTVRETSNATTTWYTLSLSPSATPSSMVLKPVIANTYNFVTSRTTLALMPSTPAATSNIIVKFRTVPDTLGPSSLVNPDGYVGIPRTAWSSLYFDIQELLTSSSGDHALTTGRTVKYADPEPMEEVYTKDGELVVTGPFVHNYTSVTSLLVSQSTFPVAVARDDDGSTYVLVNSDLSTKLIKYDSNMEYVWKSVTMPLVIDRSSLITYYVGTIMVHHDDRNVFVLSTIERADAKVWCINQDLPYVEPPASADSVQSIIAFSAEGQINWAKLVYPPSQCAWVEWFAATVSKTDDNGNVHFVMVGDCATPGQPYIQSTWIYHAILRMDTLGDKEYELIRDEHFSVDVGVTEGSSGSIYSVDVIDNGRALVITGEVNYQLQAGTGDTLVGGDTYVAIINMDDYTTAAITTWNGDHNGGSDQSYGLLQLPTSPPIFTGDGCLMDASNGIVPLQYIFVTTLDGASEQTGNIAMKTTLNSLCITASFPPVIDSSTGDAIIIDDSSTASPIIGSTGNNGVIGSSSSSTPWIQSAGGIVVIILLLAAVIIASIWVYRRRYRSLASHDSNKANHNNGSNSSASNASHHDRNDSGGELSAMIPGTNIKDERVSQANALQGHQQLKELSDIDISTASNPDSQIHEV